MAKVQFSQEPVIARTGTEDKISFVASATGETVGEVTARVGFVKKTAGNAGKDPVWSKEDLVILSAAQAKLSYKIAENMPETGVGASIEDAIRAFSAEQVGKLDVIKDPDFKARMKVALSSCFASLLDKKAPFYIWGKGPQNAYVRDMSGLTFAEVAAPIAKSENGEEVVTISEDI